MEEDKRKKKQASLLAVFLILIIVILGILNFTLLKDRVQDTYTINVEQSLKKDNFIKQGNYIIESLASDCTIVGKFIRDNVCVLQVRILKTDDLVAEIEVNPEIYDKFNEGNTVDLQRKVYYTLEGKRLYNTDSITEHKGDIDEVIQ